MLTISIPEYNDITLHHLVLDMNGTLARDGVLLPGVKERLDQLKPWLEIHLITADTHSGGRDAARRLGIQFHKMTPGPGGPQKLTLVRDLNPTLAVAIGNGANDALMLKEAALGIAVNGGEGAAVAAILAADIYIPDILDALDLLLHPDRIRATLRR
ncbi:MAG TPA: ATPase P [Caldilineales bacterium]|nr:ATPase P [Caldilineales bacterium]